MRAERRVTIYEMLIRVECEERRATAAWLQGGAAAVQYQLSQCFCVTTKALHTAISLISGSN